MCGGVNLALVLQSVCLWSALAVIMWARTVSHEQNELFDELRPVPWSDVERWQRGLDRVIYNYKQIESQTMLAAWLCGLAAMVSLSQLAWQYERRRAPTRRPPSAGASAATGSAVHSERK